MYNKLIKLCCLLILLTGWQLLAQTESAETSVNSNDLLLSKITDDLKQLTKSQCPENTCFVGGCEISAFKISTDNLPLPGLDNSDTDSKKQASQFRCQVSMSESLDRETVNILKQRWQTILTSPTYKVEVKTAMIKELPKKEPEVAPPPPPPPILNPFAERWEKAQLKLIDLIPYLLSVVAIFFLLWIIGLSLLKTFKKPTIIKNKKQDETAQEQGKEVFQQEESQQLRQIEELLLLQPSVLAKSLTPWLTTKKFSTLNQLTAIMGDKLTLDFINMLKTREDLHDLMNEWAVSVPQTPMDVDKAAADALLNEVLQLMRQQLIMDDTKAVSQQLRFINTANFPMVSARLSKMPLEFQLAILAHSSLDFTNYYINHLSPKDQDSLRSAMFSQDVQGVSKEELLSQIDLLRSASGDTSHDQVNYDVLRVIEQSLASLSRSEKSTWFVQQFLKYPEKSRQMLKRLFVDELLLEANSALINTIMIQIPTEQGAAYLKSLEKELSKKIVDKLSPRLQTALKYSEFADNQGIEQVVQTRQQVAQFLRTSQENGQFSFEVAYKNQFQIEAQRAKQLVEQMSQPNLKKQAVGE